MIPILLGIVGLVLVILTGRYLVKQKVSNWAILGWFVGFILVGIFVNYLLHLVWR